MSAVIKGIAASNGIAIAKAYRLDHPDLTVKQTTITDPAAEISRFDAAVAQSKLELEAIKARTEAELGADKAEIFASHLLVLEDPEFVDEAKNAIENDKVNAEYALQEVSNMTVDFFLNMDSDYMKERAADIRDVTKRLLTHLMGIGTMDLGSISEEVVLIAEDLTPSDTAQLNRDFVKGFATDIGGRTSHSAIMARSMEIPAVVGAKSVTANIVSGVMVVVDGLTGEIVVDPSADELRAYEAKRDGYAAQKAEWLKVKDEPSVSADGHAVELAANIGTPQDVAGVVANGGEAVGLYRTEFLYMGRDSMPTEEEQFDAYRTVLENMGGKPVVVRTLDIGGDKELPYLDLPKEMNPFLGFRAIRLCLEKQDIFRTQLRALLRASSFGNLKIMFPMIATLGEFREAKAILLEEKEKLVASGTTVAEKIELGIMVEIPSTAMLADRFAKEADFFSIGTNDLIQYTMAADRMNEQVSYLYQPFNPAILRMVKRVIDAAHAEGKWAGMCGEMAGDLTAIPLLLGLGLDEFSMSATSILPARTLIRKLSKADCEAVANEALDMDTAEDVVALIQSRIVTK
ncbi:phosphoenolpyruvate-protein phosphotransferase [Paenibacillus swuensis]|uniref:Phosphoenolpyruvate-protein phosphotransferase n=1 Tax=Paenibacillus swuensis TaxID=1178515 RepID=A0A172TGE8_9BACL|nr:phosphoenolpyruvate--protein phosphotransferase [Paenibacillus swuensis]ANE46128.1 phosphoenolpyruvate-protein phosphotransferase [Paenibacillus swuensis]